MRNHILIISALLVFFTVSSGFAERQAPLAFDLSSKTMLAAIAPETSASPVFLETDTFDDEAEYAIEKNNYVSDPFEGWNRFWFDVNDTLYLDVFKPIHKGYATITPVELRSGVSNFFHNLLYPVRFVSCVLQGKFGEAGVESARFIVNTMAGAGGLMRPAKKKKALIEISPDEEDLGQALGHWGIGQGIYIVWPIIGPSTTRDTVGFIGDGFFNPVSYLTPASHSYVLRGYNRFTSFDETLAQYEELKKSAIEPYTAIRNAYVQMRQAKAEQ